MKIQDSREKDLPRKQEGGSDDGKTLKFPTSSRSWSGLKDSRIVRVSRSFGGKDRHSKVRTIRGLRDRRVRLSVPTAIQLYDLQDRLGLNQPSKVVDWLLNATQQEIDKLPPLEMPSFAQYPHSIPVSHEIAPPASTSSPMEYIKGEGSGSLTLQSLQSSKESRFEDNATEGGQATQLKPKYWNSDVLQRTQFSEFPRDLAICEKGSSVNGNEQENIMPYAAYFHHLESTNVSISHLGGYSSQVAEDPQNYHPTIIPSSSQSSLPILFCPSNFPSYMAASVNYDRQSINNFQLAPSASQILLPDSLPSSFHPVGPTMKLSISPKQHNSQNQ